MKMGEIIGYLVATLLLVALLSATEIADWIEAYFKRRRDRNKGHDKKIVRILNNE